MPSVSRRRRPAQEDESEEEQPRAQRRRTQAREEEDDDEAPEDDDEDGGQDMDVDSRSDGQDQLVKKMVRYALACEYQRIPIRRTGVNEKVIGNEKGGGTFKRVFDGAQAQLREVFGMEMVELPAKEKLTMREKKAAQKSKGASKPTASYILTSILPTKYKVPAIMPPSIIGSVEEEGIYIGLCSVIVSIIALRPSGTIGDARLRAHLGKMNLESNTGIGKTEDLLKKMINQGYIHKVVEKNADEETIDWVVGPRGKVEIATKGIRGLVLEVYGENAPDDLDSKLKRSLGMEITSATTNGSRNGREAEEEQEEEGVAPDDGGPGPSTPRRGRRH